MLRHRRPSSCSTPGTCVTHPRPSVALPSGTCHGLPGTAAGAVRGDGRRGRSHRGRWVVPALRAPGCVTFLDAAKPRPLRRLQHRPFLLPRSHPRRSCSPPGCGQWPPVASRTRTSPLPVCLSHRPRVPAMPPQRPRPLFPEWHMSFREGQATSGKPRARIADAATPCLRHDRARRPRSAAHVRRSRAR